MTLSIIFMTSLNVNVNVNVNDNEDENNNDLNKIKKLNMVKKINKLQNYGVKFTKHYDMNSSYEEMKYEYELHMEMSHRIYESKLKNKSIDLINLIMSAYLANEKYNMFRSLMNDNSPKEKINDIIQNDIDHIDNNEFNIEI